MDRRTDSLVNPRRAPIPRPWLSGKEQFGLPQPYPYGQPYNPGAQGAGHNHHNLDLLEKKDWNVSWGKLHCCFCMRGTSHKSPTDRRISQHDGGAGGRRPRQNPYYDHVPFPAFPILRRNSSSSLLVDENEVYDESGSVSSFTESDTSYSDSEGVREESLNAFDQADWRPQKPAHRRPSTPNAAQVKPPIISNRSRSAGLPPIKPGLAQATPPQAPAARKRMDTADFSKYSGTTTTSRHRRRQQFEFSPQNMSQIWRKQPLLEEKNVMPPPYVLCQGDSSILYDSGYLSALEDSSTFDSPAHGGARGGSFDEESDYNRGANGNVGFSPFTRLERKLATDSRNRRKDERPPKADGTKNRRRRGKEGHTSKASKADKNQTAPEISYLRKDAKLDKMAEGTIVISGWVAASIGSDSLEARLQRSSGRIEARHIYYLQIVDITTGSAAGGARVFLYSTGGKIEHAFPLQPDWMCESREISSRIGRCVTLRARSAAGSTIANLLPVNMDDSFFSNGSLISPQKFEKAYERMASSGKSKAYAPDEQHDAAMFIMFSLDSLIKKYC